MAESADRSDLTERYSAIERAYCADQWGAVIDQGQQLLQEIPRTSAAVPEGLKERVQLLMAHAHLYGFNEQDVAEDLYSDVLHSKAELALRQIAEQGLQQCSVPQQVQPGAQEAGRERQESPQEVAVEPAPAAATGAAPQTAPDQAPPSRDPGESADREAAMAPADAPPSAAPATPTPPTATETPLAPAVTEPVAAAPTAASSSPAMPWLVAGAAVGTVGAAATQAAAAPMPWAAVAPAAATPDAPSASETQPEPVAAATPQPPAAAMAAEPEAPVQEPGLAEATLIPEVVDEPELFEIHQADPALAEELDLTVMEAPASPTATPTAASGSLAAAAALAAAQVLNTEAGDGPTTADAPADSKAWQAAEAIQGTADSGFVPAQEPSPAADGPSIPLSLSKDGRGQVVAAGPVFEMFRNPPAPVEEEDQELLLGLLRVLVRSEAMVGADSASDGG